MRGAESEGQDVTESIRFNEVIDEALTESTNRNTDTVNRTREQFLGMLGHDLRNALGAIPLCATVLSRDADLSARTCASPRESRTAPSAWTA